MRIYYLLVLAYLFFITFGFFQMRTSTIASTNQLEIPPSVSEKTEWIWDEKKEGKKLFKWSLLALLFALAGLFPLMGLPGMLAIGFYELTGIIKKEEVEGHKMWPAAIIVSLLWPLGIPIGLLLRQLGIGVNIGFLISYGVIIGLVVWMVSVGFIIKR